jgi:hypothetical protein
MEVGSQRLLAPFGKAGGPRTEAPHRVLGRSFVRVSRRKEWPPGNPIQTGDGQLFQLIGVLAASSTPRSIAPAAIQKTVMTRSQVSELAEGPAVVETQVVWVPHIAKRNGLNEGQRRTIKAEACPRPPSSLRENVAQTMS